MIDKSAANLWWEEIYGPRISRNEICKAISSAQSVIIIGDAIPWPKTLISLIKVELQENLGLYLEEINGYDNIENPGEFLLRKFGKPEEINKYRAGIHPSLPDYIKSIHALENKLIFITGLEAKTYELWEKFINQYRAKNEKEGLFLIEAFMPISDTKNSNRITKVDIMSKISFYDILSFSIFLSSSLKTEEIWKQYTAWTTGLLFSKKIESLANIYSDKLLQSSILNYHAILKTETSDEIFFNKALWTAQLQILFPIIENLRLIIINNHKSEIEYILQTEDCFYCDKKVTDPYDAELGFLIYLSRISSKRLFDAETYKNILFLHDCRNHLAHLEYCDISDIEKIIELNNNLK